MNSNEKNPISGRKELEEWSLEKDISCTELQWDQLLSFLSEVEAHNKKVNITADEGEDLLLRHAADALALLSILRKSIDGKPPPFKILDLGAGAGFVGMTLKIVRSELDVTLLESSYRKFSFLNWIAAEMKFPGLHVILGRAPEVLRGKKFDAVVIRAVTSAHEAARLGLPGLAPGGLCVLYQSRAPILDSPHLKRALADLGGEVQEVIPYRLPKEKEDRHFLVLKKNL